MNFEQEIQELHKLVDQLQTLVNGKRCDIAIEKIYDLKALLDQLNDKPKESLAPYDQSLKQFQKKYNALRLNLAQQMSETSKRMKKVKTTSRVARAYELN